MSEHHEDADPRMSLNGSADRHADLHADRHADRRAELLSAAVADDLSPPESRELDTLCAQDPELAQELSELHKLTSALRAGLGSWSVVQPPARLREKVLTQVNAAQSHRGSSPRASTPQAAPAQPVSAGTARSIGRSRLRQSLALAACVAVGVVGTLGVQAFLDADSADTADGLVAVEPLGPPGELGAQEPVSFSDPGAGVEVDGALVAHTWGTETVLEIDGLAPGDAFTVVLVGDDGEEIESGSFLGSEVPVDCRMNGAVLREDVERLEIRDESGLAITAAALPEVE